jgi:hypothetical protein
MAKSCVDFYPFVISSGEQARKLKGIGKSTAILVDVTLSGKINCSKPETSEKSVTGFVIQKEEKSLIDDDSFSCFKATIVSKMTDHESFTSADALVGLESKFGNNKYDIDQALSDMLDEGLIYSTIDENHFSVC